ncbi:MAG TPA: cobalamin-binding protein, partial [Dehalococcoidia bacterium]
MRIASLLPSATEILFALGLGDSVVGVTHECDFPDEARSKPHLTRSLIPAGLSSAEIDAAVVQSQRDLHTLYALDSSLLASLRPDLVITQSLCDVCAVPRSEVDEAVCTMPREADVISLDPTSLEDVLRDVLRVGEACDRRDDARKVVAGLEARIEAVCSKTAGAMRPSVFVAEWLDPIFCAGHWLPGMVEIAGGCPLLGRRGEDSERVEWDAVLAAGPDVMLLMACGFDAQRTLEEASCMTARHGWADVPAVRSGRVFVMDGNAYFARPGPRLVDGTEMMARAFQPYRFDDLLPDGVAFK